MALRYVGGADIDTFVSGDQGFIEPQLLAGVLSESEVEFYSTTRAGNLRLLTAREAEEAYGEEVTLVLDDEFGETKDAHYGEVFAKNKTDLTAPLIPLGIQPKGTVKVYPLFSPTPKDYDIFVVPRTKDFEYGRVQPQDNAFDSLTGVGGVSGGGLETGTTPITGTDDEVLFIGAGGVLSSSPNFTFDGSQLLIGGEAKISKSGTGDITTLKLDHPSGFSGAVENRIDFHQTDSNLIGRIANIYSGGGYRFNLRFYTRTDGGLNSTPALTLLHDNKAVFGGAVDFDFPVSITGTTTPLSIIDDASGIGSREVLKLRRNASLTAGDEEQTNFYHTTENVGRFASYLNISGYKFGLKFYTYNETALNSTAALELTYNNKVVPGGDIEFTDSAHGVILKRPDGTLVRVTINNSNALVFTTI